jgi:hypothetical protein
VRGGIGRRSVWRHCGHKRLGAYFNILRFEHFGFFDTITSFKGCMSISCVDGGGGVKMTGQLTDSEKERCYCVSQLRHGYVEVMQCTS